MDLKNMHVYMMPPLDTWRGWTRERDFITLITIDPNWIAASEELATYFDIRAWGMKVAKTIGWEGDIRRDEIYVTGLPVEGEYMIAWKQDNNGTTFVATPHWLPWLDADALAHTYERSDFR